MLPFLEAVDPFEIEPVVDKILKFLRAGRHEIGEQVGIAYIRGNNGDKARVSSRQ